MSRPAWTIAFALCIGPLTVAAPAPPQRLATAEAVVVPLKGNVREVAAWLLSPAMIASLAKSQAGRACLKGENDIPMWLAKRLRATVDEGRKSVTIRLADCPRADALALLTAVVDAYKGHALAEHGGRQVVEEELVQVQVLAGMQAQQQVVFRVRQNVAAGGAIFLDLDPDGRPDNPLVKAAVDRSVTQSPRLVPIPVFGRDASPPRPAHAR